MFWELLKTAPFDLHGNLWGLRWPVMENCTQADKIGKIWISAEMSRDEVISHAAYFVLISRAGAGRLVSKFSDDDLI